MKTASCKRRRNIKNTRNIKTKRKCRKPNYGTVTDVEFTDPWTMHILPNLESCKDVLNACSTNKQLYNMCNEYGFWRRVGKKFFGVDTINDKETFVKYCQLHEINQYVLNLYGSYDEQPYFYDFDNNLYNP